MQLIKYSFRFLIITLLAANILSCASKKNELQDLSPEQLYQRGVNLTKNRNYYHAVKSFSQISIDYPYDPLALKAQVMEAYVNYLARDYDMTFAVIENFVKFHPGSKDVAYMYYLKALSYYEQIADASRDQKNTELAKDALNEVITRFPLSTYSKDCKVKLELVVDHLAGKEMEVGRYYLHRNQAIAAINHFKIVVEQYQTTSHVAEALFRLTEAYLFLGLYDEAKHNAAVLGHNYPKSKWYHYSYQLVRNFKTPTQTSTKTK